MASADGLNLQLGDIVFWYHAGIDMPWARLEGIPLSIPGAEVFVSAGTAF